MEYLKIGGEVEASRVSLGCMRMRDKTKKEVFDVIDTAVD